MESSSSTASRFDAAITTERQLFHFKIIWLGDIAVGKTSLWTRFINNTFKDEYSCSIGVEFKVKTMYIDNSFGAELNVWDTCGEEKYRTITRQYYRYCDAILLVFDLTNLWTVNNLQSWWAEIKENVAEDSIIYIIGSKADLTDKRVVNETDVQRIWSNWNDLRYYEISSKTGSNIQELFVDLVRNLIWLNKSVKDESVSHLTESEEHKKIKRDDGVCC